VALKTSSYVILGLVRGGISSGYALKRFVEQQRLDAFWSTTFAQIYPDLAELEERGYLTHRDDPHGGRRRRAYALTPKGERALQSWLRRPRIPPRELRDEGLLRLALADALPREDAIELVGRLKARAEDAAREFEEEIIPLGRALSSSLGLRFPAEVCRIGAGYQSWLAEHFEQLEAELRAEAGTMAAEAARLDGAGPA
jgi:DNA-binding PadR family transcriptional regulator